MQKLLSPFSVYTILLLYLLTAAARPRLGNG
jgi:hypothetical protein